MRFCRVPMSLTWELNGSDCWTHNHTQKLSPSKVRDIWIRALLRSHNMDSEKFSEFKING